MFSAENFYHGTFRKAIIVFGNLFNDITFERRMDENRVQTIAVPLAYGPRSKFIAPFLADERIDQNVAIQLPRMGFEIMTVNRATTTRNQIPITRNVHRDPDDPDRIRSQFVGIPWDIGIRLSIYSLNSEDMCQIVEQILPYFAPDWTVSIYSIPEMGYKEDVVIELQPGIGISDQAYGEMVRRRVLIWELDFNLKIKFYGPVRKSGLIKRTQIDFHAAPGTGPVTNEEVLTTPRSSRYVLVPGLTPEGEPTTNAAASIHYTQIEEDDNWGFAESFYFYTDGKIYDPVTGRDIQVPDLDGDDD